MDRKKERRANGDAGRCQSHAGKVRRLEAHAAHETQPGPRRGDRARQQPGRRVLRTGVRGSQGRR